MFQIQTKSQPYSLEIKNSNSDCFAKIYLDLGASLQELKLSGKDIIVDLHPLRYSDTFASSILFPFANRIKDGRYSFEGEEFQLPTNQIEEKNALHGFVYNKTFQVTEQKQNQNSAFIKLKYSEKEKTVGFPFTYDMILEYTFTENSVALNISILNTDVNAFPFTLGWHPYFHSSNLFESTLDFSSNEKLVIGERNITTGTEVFNDSKIFKIEDKKLDDCWILNSKVIGFNTPDYQFELESSEKKSFLQAYTPPKKNIIAIEPTTGVSDSFNNKIGLKILKPDENYNIQWKLKIIDN